MAYKVFISHSTCDQGLVMYLARLLQKFGVDAFVAEWYLTPGEPLDKKIEGQIRSSDCVVVLLTRNGIRSTWVQQEIGYSLGQGKPIIPIVEKGIDSKVLGALEAREYIEYDPRQYDDAINKLVRYVESIKLKKGKETLLVLGALLAFLLLISGRSK
ncbi:MAG: toll/interleukin-1 receptor domain-containing protein [Phycisphaerae bacterium]